MTATETFYQSFFPAPNVKLKVLEFFEKSCISWAFKVNFNQERASKHKFCLTFNRKSTLKKQAENVNYIKSKLNQVSILAFLDW